MFIVGHEYTRDAIHAQLGGSKRACMPTVGGIVVAACLLKAFNPETPQVVLCGTGPSNGPAGVLLATQREAIPFFTRIATGRWVHEGRFEAAEVLTHGARYDMHVARSSREPSSVSRVVLMRRVAA